MRFLLICGFALTSFFGLSQGRGMVWGEYGVKGKVVVNLDWGAEMTTRFGTYGMETIFPQLTLRYKVTKWFRPSLDFRSVFDLDKYGNYLNASRLNMNADFKHEINRFKIGARVRYQYSFNSLGNKENYDVEFDQAIRFKPSVAYDFKGSFLSPIASVEFFLTDGVNVTRAGAGVHRRRLPGLGAHCPDGRRFRPLGSGRRFRPLGSGRRFRPLGSLSARGSFSARGG
jgi:hypothetical protein